MAEKKTTKAEAAEEEVFVPAEEKKVLIKLPIDFNSKEDEVVTVNGRRFLIKRGVPVEVPESVALILKQKEESLQEIYEYNQKNAKEV